MRIAVRRRLTDLADMKFPSSIVSDDASAYNQAFLEH